MGGGLGGGWAGRGPSGDALTRSEHCMLLKRKHAFIADVYWGLLTAARNCEDLLCCHDCLATTQAEQQL